MFAIFKRKKKPKEITVKDVLNEEKLNITFEEFVTSISHVRPNMTYYDFVKELSENGFSDFKVGFYLGIVMTIDKVHALLEQGQEVSKKKQIQRGNNMEVV